MDITLSGAGLMSYGFLGNQYALSPLGVITRGFINSCDSIWWNAEELVSTVWTEVVDPNANLESC